MAEKNQHKYDESKIKTLSSLEHIRLRTGMYIGRLGDGSHYDDGVYILLKEVIDNAVDEYIMGHGKKIDITINEKSVLIRDYGRGIPLGKVVECVSKINTGAKYNDDVFQFSVGLNGVGTKAVNALSSQFLVRSHREGKYSEARFKRGCLLEQKKGKNKDALEGTLVEYIPDPSIFKKFIKYDFQLIQRRLRHYSYLNSGLRLICNGEVFYSKNGILDLLKEEIGEESIYKPIHFVSKILEFTFTHSNRRYGETFYSFVNGQYTSDGGIHLSAFREGILKGVNEFSKKKFDGEDVRESIVGAISIRLKEPIFESQTKNKLGNTEIRSELVNRVKEIVIDLLHKNRETAERILSKVEDTQQLRKELQKVKKMARERSKTVTFRIPQLKDCKYHLGDKKGKGGESMVFITEGVSAAGSIVSCRDVNTQAIFTLKGKPLNVCDLKRDALYKNDEMYNLMRGLNIEESVDSLRYQKVILATDADVDGLHIRNLLITYFLRFFDALVEREHLFILETPLFRVRNKKETHYCYSEAERDKAVGKLKRGCEITRFKGLGEISPKEFKNFVGSKMKLTRVESASKPVISKILSFYMGRNTPERRNYIMDHLVVDDND
ncbi:MAG TPA: type IIA DNA topoisomerase subunit B [Verrucomicrobiales bacterium]|nr:type IIA DNA topoisomerase subunit B [Verrucomicrobiales bacterium]